MQNAGLATVLASNFFASQPLTLLPCAISCAWHSISGTILAGLYLRWDLRHPAAVKAAEAERATQISGSVNSEAIETGAVTMK